MPANARQSVPIRVVIFLLGVGCLTQNLAAHPVSHTDAWIRVSDSVDIRLTMFLDDVLRYQQKLESKQTTVGAAEVNAAIAAHSILLLRQLRVFDQSGQPLTGAVISTPKWDSGGRDVDVSADASLKLTWNLQYSQVTPESPLRSLVFLHNFTHPELTQPGELRLHLQHLASGRRIDAVIPPARPHTIMLPETAASPNDVDQNDVEPDSPAMSVNTATSRILVGPTQIVHEFTAPLLLLDSVWPASSHLRSVTTDLNIDAAKIDASEVEVVREQVADWMGENTFVMVNQKVLKPTVIVIEFLPPVGSTDDNPAEQRELTDGLAVFGTVVGARLIYRRPRNVRSVKMEMSKSPGPFDDVNVTVVSSAERFSVLIPFSKSPDASKPAWDYQWTLSKQLADSGPRTGRLPVGDATSPVTLILVYPGWRGLVASLFCIIVSALLYRAIRARGSFSARAVVGLLTAVMIAVSLWTFPQEYWVVDQPRTSSMLQSMLGVIYESLAQTDENASVSMLSDVLDDEMVQSVYLAAIGSLHSDTELPLVEIESVVVESCAPREGESDPSTIVTDCSWRVNGTVQHWGHSHRRTLLMSGRLTLAATGRHWKIRSMTQTVVSELTAEANSAS